MNDISESTQLEIYKKTIAGHLFLLIEEAKKTQKYTNIDDAINYLVKNYTCSENQEYIYKYTLPFIIDIYRKDRNKYLKRLYRIRDVFDLIQFSEVLQKEIDKNNK